MKVNLQMAHKQSQNFQEGRVEYTEETNAKLKLFARSAWPLIYQAEATFLAAELNLNGKQEGRGESDLQPNESHWPMFNNLYVFYLTSSNDITSCRYEYYTLTNSSLQKHFFLQHICS